jgi:hypothetical protein
MAKKNQVVSKEQKKFAAKRGFATSAKAKVAAGVVGVATLFGPVACDNGTSSTPKVCNCPNGTVHEAGTAMPCCDGDDCTCTVKQPVVCICDEGTFHDEGEACCDGENCECKEAFDVYLGSKKIRVEDTTGLANKEEIQNGLNTIDNLAATDPSVVHFKGMNTNPIMVIETSHNLRVEEGGRFFMGIEEINSDATNIVNAIVYIYNSGGSPKMTKLLNIQFDAMKNIIYIGRAAIQRQHGLQV